MYINICAPEIFMLSGRLDGHMKIIVLSDVHGDRDRARRVLMSQSKAEVVIFCGDGAGDMEQLRSEFPNKAFFMVRGNCDWGSSLPLQEVVTLEGVKIFFTHGHTYQAKLTEYDMKSAADSCGATILLYGHTHNAVNYYEDGLYVMNPGSCSGYGASYGIVEILPSGILTNIVHIK